MFVALALLAFVAVKFGANDKLSNLYAYFLPSVIILLAIVQIVLDIYLGLTFSGVAYPDSMWPYIPYGAIIVAVILMYAKNRPWLLK